MRRGTQQLDFGSTHTGGVRVAHKWVLGVLTLGECAWPEAGTRSTHTGGVRVAHKWVLGVLTQYDMRGSCGRAPRAPKTTAALRGDVRALAEPTWTVPARSCPSHRALRLRWNRRRYVRRPSPAGSALVQTPPSWRLTPRRARPRLTPVRPPAESESDRIASLGGTRSTPTEPRREYSCACAAHVTQGPNRASGGERSAP